MPMSHITIYHNPACSTSRKALAMIVDSGVEPVVIEYLKHPPDRDTLVSLAQRMGGGVRDLLRTKAPPYSELGLAASHWSDAQLLDFIAQHPVLIERPIVATPLGVRVCRPIEKVLEILPKA
jgi:arsenate reductase